MRVQDGRRTMAYVGLACALLLMSACAEPSPVPAPPPEQPPEEPPTSAVIPNPVEEYATSLGLSEDLVSMLRPLGEDEVMDENERAFVDLAVVCYPKTNQILPGFHGDIMKLPDLSVIDEKDVEAMEDIFVFASNAEYEAAFESMMDEGIRDKRKYCSPLEALLWIAYDKEFAGYNPLVGYSLKKLLREAWENTSTSKDYSSDRWQDFDEVVDRLNSPDLVIRYMRDNVPYVYEARGGWQTASATFERKRGQCGDHAIFAAYLLINSGYESNILVVGEFSSRLTKTHALCLYKDEDDGFYTIDSGDQSSVAMRRGPYSTIEERAREICRMANWSYEGYELYDMNQRMVLKRP